jgi:[ribosomal protein S5]-alanine N-acetyltransferase
MNSPCLIQIDAYGNPAESCPGLPAAALEVCSTTAALYRRTGFVPPWTGYLAVLGMEVVGTCAFAAPAANGQVEIAYYTFPAHEGRGVATAMAQKLVALARATDPRITVMAQTAAATNASNAILRKLGFAFAGAVPHAEEGEVWEWHLPAAGR